MNDDTELRGEPIEDPRQKHQELMEQMAIPELDIKVEMFEIYPDDRNGDLKKYEKLLNELYDVESDKVALEAYGTETCFGPDGCFKAVVHYGQEPQTDDDEDEEEPDFSELDF